MDDQAYYLIPGQEQSNVSDKTVPLQINSSGYCKRRQPYNHKELTGRNDYLLQYIMEDELVIQINGKDRRYPKGSFIIYPPHKPYSYKSPNSRAQFYWVHFSGFNVGRLLANLGIIPGKVYITSAAYKSTSNITFLFAKIFDEFTQRRPGFADISTAYLTEILVALSREADKSRAGDHRNLTSIAYLHQNFRDSTLISELAAMDHLGVSRYREIFHEQMGMSPIDYRTALRIQHACELLSQTDLTVSEIAQDSGFTDIFYFARMFKAKTGMPPKKYRDKEKNKKEAE